MYDNENRLTIRFTCATTVYSFSACNYRKNVPFAKFWAKSGEDATDVKMGALELIIRVLQKRIQPACVSKTVSGEKGRESTRERERENEHESMGA